MVTRVWIGAREFSVRSAHAISGATLLKVHGVDNRSQADELRGAGVAVARTDLPPLAADEYYAVDLEGCEAWSTLGMRLGVVSCVVNFGAGDVLRLIGEGPAQEHDERLLSLGPGVLAEVNLAERKIILKLPAGVL